MPRSFGLDPQNEQRVLAEWHHEAGALAAKSAVPMPCRVDAVGTTA
jgi:hypothetical protein